MKVARRSERRCQRFCGNEASNNIGENLVTKGEFEQSDDKVEATRLAAALRDPSGWPRPTAGFAERCLEWIMRHGDASGLRRAWQSNIGGESRWRAPRWVKVAASVAAMAAFAGLAAVVGRVVLNAQQPAAEAVGPNEPQEQETISQKGESNMIMARKVAALAGAAVLTVSAPAAKLSSEPTFVFLRPETSSFWNTATNSTMTLPIDYPSGATKATLTVNGVGYNRVYPNLTGTSIEIDLPVPDSPKTENVYELTLAFDNGAASRTAKLGLIKGLDSGAKGSTR